MSNQTPKDSRSFTQALFWALLVFLLWQMIAIRIWPPPKAPEGGDVTSNGVVNTDTSGVAVSDAPPPETVFTSGFHVRGAALAETLVMGTTNGFEKSPYRMELAFTSRGAAISNARLSDHQRRVEFDDRYQVLRPLEMATKTWHSLAVEQVLIDEKHKVILANVPWRAERVAGESGDTVRFTVDVLEGETPVLQLERSFTLPQQPASDQRFDLLERLTVRNIGDQPHSVRISTRGPVGMTAEAKAPPDRRLFAAYDTSAGIGIESEDFKSTAQKAGIKLFDTGREQNMPLAWHGGSNLYFTCTTAPVQADGKKIDPRIDLVEAVDLDEDTETLDDATTRTTTQAMDLPPATERTLHGAIYLGPKDRAVFESPANEDYIARNYALQIELGYSWCTFKYLTRLMTGILNGIFKFIPNYGIAIIMLVVLVRTLLHPITKKTQISMLRMQQNMSQVQPKLEAVKKKFAGDNAKMQQEIMKVYREEGVNPFGQVFTCLPMLLQMPIWIALYSSLRNNVAMRGEGFVFWINDLSRPDHLMTFDPAIKLPIVGWQLDGLHLLPVLVGVTMFAQQKLMPKPKRPAGQQLTPQQEQMERTQKIMPYMSLVMILIFYPFPSGLNLYIMASSIIGTAEQLYIRGHIKRIDLQKPSEKKKSGNRRLPAFLQRLQQKAEEAQKLSSKRESGKAQAAVKASIPSPQSVVSQPQAGRVDTRCPSGI